jgi:glycosyltransferase involved in cell wall biosynthesis
MKIKRTMLSLVLATRNEEANIAACLKSARKLADEIIVYDEYSTDKTREIAKRHGAKVYKYKHKKNFHETKQKAIDKASADWILQLDADERVTPKLAKEIIRVINMSNEKLLSRKLETEKRDKLFIKHQQLIEQREGSLSKKTGEVVAFFVPRVNYFLGKPLIHAGVYPDGIIRLIKKGKARLPGKSVHELMEVDGEVAWLFNDLEHHESPTLQRYLERMNRYTDLHAEELKEKGVSANYLNLFLYTVHRPLFTFLNLYFRHKGILDGMHGFVWSIFSALHFPLAYFKFWQTSKK